MAVTLVQEHFWLFISIIAICFQVALAGFLAGRARGKVFTRKFMDDNFGDLHFRETKYQVSEEGYPDMGNGKYSTKLSYNDWLYFNNAQRVHYNYLENITLIVVYAALAGLYYPLGATYCCLAIFIGRFAYFFYNSAQGAAHPARRVGSAITSLAQLALLVFAVLAAFKFYGEFQPSTPTPTPTPTPAPKPRGK
jgi:hypothetical protein